METVERRADRSRDSRQPSCAMSDRHLHHGQPRNGHEFNGRSRFSKEAISLVGRRRHTRIRSGSKMGGRCKTAILSSPTSRIGRPPVAIYPDLPIRLDALVRRNQHLNGSFLPTEKRRHRYRCEICERWSGHMSAAQGRDVHRRLRSLQCPLAKAFASAGPEVRSQDGT